MHKPEFKAKVELIAIKGELTMAEMVKIFDVQAAQITQWKKQLLVLAGAAFEKSNQMADPYLLADLDISRPNHVWATVIIFFADDQRFHLPGGRHGLLSPTCAV